MCIFFLNFFYLLHVAAISFLPEPTASFSRALQLSDSYQAVYVEWCDLSNCSRSSKFRQIFHSYRYLLQAWVCFVFPSLWSLHISSCFGWYLHKLSLLLIFRKISLNRISPQVFDNGMFTQEVRPHSVPLVMEAARRAAEAQEGSGLWLSAVLNSHNMSVKWSTVRCFPPWKLISWVFSQRGRWIRMISVSRTEEAGRSSLLPHNAEHRKEPLEIWADSDSLPCTFCFEAPYIFFLTCPV